MTFNISMKYLVFRALLASVILGFIAFTSLAQDQTVQGRAGILLLAHGGKANWNEEVVKVARSVDKTVITEVAFGMASKRNIQSAAEKLIDRGATEIVVIPLFVSSHSSVIESSEYLLGLRPDAPRDLAVFAKMDHGPSNGGSHGSHGSHGANGSGDATTPIRLKVPVRMVSALNAHPIVGEILLSRARAISTSPTDEVVIVVAHGPVSDAANSKWLADMRLLAGLMGRKSAYRRIEYVTVRDDAPEPIRAQATAELRARVERASKENARALVVPLLISYGGIEEGIRKRLDGLTYTMCPQAILPDERISGWVVESARTTVSKK